MLFHFGTKSVQDFELVVLLEILKVCQLFLEKLVNFHYYQAYT